MSFTCTGTPLCLPILTTVVYDYCYQDELFDLSETAACTAPSVPSSLTCSVTVTCNLVGSVPALTPGYILTTWTYSGTLTLTWNCDGTPTHTDIPFYFWKPNVLLCSPNGTTPVCEASVQQTPFIDFANNTVGAHIAVCLQFEVLRDTKLLVQTFGEVTPSECQTGGLLPCPPAAMPLPCDP